MKTKLFYLGLIFTVGLLTSTTNLSRTFQEEWKIKVAQLYSFVSISYLAAKTLENVQEALPKGNNGERHLGLSLEPLQRVVELADRNPHIMIISKTGGGKSTLAQYLASFCKGKRFAISPHFDQTNPDEWKNCHGVFATGRNYGSEKDPEINYEDIISGNFSEAPTATQIIRAIEQEMDKRYKSDAPFGSHEKHDWIIDEAVAVAKNMGKNFPAWVSPLLFEARKVGIRLWILAQSDQVKTLNISGEGTIRNQFTYIYLSDQAKARSKSLGKPYPKLDDYAWCIVDEELSLRPDMETCNKVIEEHTIEDRILS